MTALAKMLAQFATAAAFTSGNPTLRIGEMGVETDTDKLKIGDGVTAWTALPYVAGTGGDAALLNGQAGSYYRARANHTGTQLMNTISNAGTAATQNTGTSGANLPFLNGNNAWSGTNGFQAVTVTTLSISAGGVIPGTYTPTITLGTNAAAATAYVTQYMRMGNVVTLGGIVDVDPTAASATTILLSLPVASDFASAQQAGGAGVFNNVNAVSICANAALNALELNFIAGVTTNQRLTFNATYLIV